MGVEYYGPFEVKKKVAKNNETLVLPSYLTPRAVPIEVVRTLDTDSCLTAIKRFIS